MKNKILILLAVAAFALAGATGMAMMSCDDKPKTPDPKCDCTNNVHNGACPAPCPGKGINPPCDCRDPNPCLCPDQANHLANGESKSCAGEPCKHTCTEQTAELAGTDIVFSKAADVTVEEMDEAVAFFIGYFNTGISEQDRTKIKGAITEVRIVSGNAAVKEGTIWKVGIGADKDILDISLYFGFAQIQPQTKSTFLVGKGNKGRAWVAKLMNDRIASVNDFRNVAYDKACEISI